MILLTLISYLFIINLNLIIIARIVTAVITAMSLINYLILIMLIMSSLLLNILQFNPNNLILMFITHTLEIVILTITHGFIIMFLIIILSQVCKKVLDHLLLSIIQITHY
jgi:hypothetical protein